MINPTNNNTIMDETNNNMTKVENDFYFFSDLLVESLLIFVPEILHEEFLEILSEFRLDEKELDDLNSTETQKN